MWISLKKFNNWEIDEVASFFHLLDSYTPLREGNDKMIQKLKSNREFTVRSFYGKLQGSAPMHFPWKAIWRTKAPQTVSFFV